MRAKDGRQRVGVLAEIPGVLQSLGTDPAKVFRVAGLDLCILDNPDNEISFVAMGRLLQACAAATGCPHFGLLAGQKIALRSLGAVGRLMQTAPTLETALRDLVLAQVRNADGSVCYLRRAGGLWAYCYAIYQPGTPAIDQIYDGAIALAFNVIRELVGRVAIEVTFSHAEPVETTVYRRFFRIPLRFDEEETSIILPAKALSLPVRSGKPEQRAELQAMLRAHPAIRDAESVVQVSRLLRAQVISGPTSLRDIAASLALHPRTLLRRLKASGTTFRGLLNETRLEVAYQLLAGTRLSITQIGLALRYADTAAFTRAFERWSGLAPSEWRARRKPILLD